MRTPAAVLDEEAHIRIRQALYDVLLEKKNMLIKNKRIAIVGGGPGGLTLARLLQMRGAEVKIYERDSNRTARVQGTTLDLHQESGLAALKKADLLAAFKANYRPEAGILRIIDQSATIRLDGHAEGQIDNFGDEHARPEIDRGPLRDILLSSLQPDTMLWDRQYVSMTLVDDIWQLAFKNGTWASADLVIAADGAHSKIRPLITPIKPVYVGITAVEGAVYNAEIAAPRIHKLLKGGKIFAFGDNQSLFVSSKGDGSFSFFTGSHTDEDWVATSGIDFHNKAQVVAWFKQEFAGWASVWMEMFENAEPHFIPRPQYCMPLDQSWTALPNLTMLGDAAHWMPPYAGEGVNMAMLDALALSECLTSEAFPDLQTAIAFYESAMRKRASAAAQMTLDSMAMLHAPNAVANLIAAFRNFELSTENGVAH